MATNFWVKNFQYFIDIFSKGRRDQAEFHTCYTTFQALQNGYKMFEKKVYLCVQITLGKLKNLPIFHGFSWKSNIVSDFLYQTAFI